MLPKIVLFNGPPRAGKDTAVNGMVSRLRETFGASSMNVKFAKVVKERTHAALGIFVKPVACATAPLGVKFELCRDGEPGSRVAPFDFFEDRKDTPLPEFQGKTPRQSYIALSELLFKPFFGTEIFGKLLLEFEVDPRPEIDTFLVSDSGFESEVFPLIARFGAESIKHVRVYRDGTGFSADSRTYLDLSKYGIDPIDLHNPAPMENPTEAHRRAYLENVSDLIDTLLNTRAMAPTV